MFKLGDKVIANGFRYAGESHKYGTNPKLTNNERDKTLLEVVEVCDDGEKIAVESDEKNFPRKMYYHPSELRVAIKSEIESAAQNFKELAAGTIIKVVGTGNVYVVQAAIDCDGDYRVAAVHHRDTTYIRHNRIEKVIAIIGEDGSVSLPA